jgi:hypothetical protein
MARLTVITDENNKVLGAVRSGVIRSENMTLQLRAHPGTKHKYHELEVPDEAMESIEDIKRHVLGKAVSR